jgi:flagellar biosynthesis protein FliQ
MQIELELLIIALVTSLTGSLVRAFYEINNKTYTRTKLLFIIITALAIAFLDYEIVTNFNIQHWAGVFGVVGGIVGIGLVKAAIEKMPNMVLDKVNRLLGGRNETYGTDNEDNRGRR